MRKIFKISAEILDVSNKMFEFLLEIFQIPSLTVNFMIMTVTLEISIEIFDNSIEIIDILTKIIKNSTEHLKTVTKISTLFKLIPTFSKK